MPGLFGIPTPEEIRSRIGATAPESELSLGGTPPFTGVNPDLYKLGGAIAYGGAKLLGIETPEDKQKIKARKMQEFNKLFSQKVKEGEIDAENDPIRSGKLAGSILSDLGLYEESNKVFGETLELANSLRKDNKELDQAARDKFMEGKAGGRLTQEAADWKAGIIEMRSKANVAPPMAGTVKPETENELNQTDVQIIDADNTISLPGGRKINVANFNNSDQFTQAVTSLANTMAQIASKEKGGKAPGLPALRAKAVELLAPYVKTGEPNLLQGAINSLWDTNLQGDSVFDYAGAAGQFPELANTGTE